MPTTVCESESEAAHVARGDPDDPQPGDPDDPQPGDPDDSAPEDRPLTAAQRARIERNRLRAKALHDARLVPSVAAAAVAPVPAPAALDSGGGFLVRADATATAPRRASPPPAPAHAHERPRCDDCGRRFAASHLLAAFGCAVCDDCRDDGGAHALLPRTEAKAEFLLKDCDLDARQPPLRFERRPNPHRGAHADMRLYLRAQVAARAELVWGGPAGLAAERERRELRRVAAAARADARRLRALRLAARSSVLLRGDASHEHRWGEERSVGDGDEYRRECLDCGAEQTYEKM